LLALLPFAADGALPKKKKPSADHSLLLAPLRQPSAKRNCAQEFAERRIAGALAHFDIDAVADHSSGLPHMLPSVDEFSRAVAAMGVPCADSPVVVYDSTPCVFCFFFVVARRACYTCLY
jgi:3-mercaptopyruvate sulfurtransferase SseA